MIKILENHSAFYHDISFGKRKHIANILRTEEIEILTGYNVMHKTVKEFYDTYYSSAQKPDIVLCGINPGRFGAGKTGVPFLDFKSLSKLLKSVNSEDEERSAQFVWKLINRFDSPLYFFNRVYLTNISWFGFLKNSKNLNYYDLPKDIQSAFTQSFIEEMNIIKPKVIIPLSQEVERTLKGMKLSCKIEKRLNHPYYCSFPQRENEELDKYVEKINKYI